MKYRKKPITIDATQWFKNGDHPQDGTETFTDGETAGERYEGKVVRYFRLPQMRDDEPCQYCGRDPERHGWIDTREGGHIVCPGDWIITGVAGEHYPCKPDIFEATYEAVDAAPGEPPNFLQHVIDQRNALGDERDTLQAESARLTAQVTELQQQLAEADAGDDIRAFERTVKEQSDRNVALQAQVEALQTARDVSEARETAYRQRVGTAEVALHAAERRADDAEAQVEALQRENASLKIAVADEKAKAETPTPEGQRP